MRRYLVPVLATFIGAAGSYAFAAGTHTVVQSEKKFSEAELTIAKGDTLVFKNEDPFTHNVYSQSPGIAFELKVQKPGESSDIKFDREGSGEIRCAIHPQMKMKLTVK
ncbi:MAG: methylamine utilization protein [Alphaproteobacteria bacterium]|nr:methylamine utilization protein [Alphaproteobacteria bacterium]